MAGVELEPLNKREKVRIGAKMTEYLCPLFSYVLETGASSEGRIKRVDIERDFFYFGDDGLLAYINRLFNIGIVRTVYDSERESRKFDLELTVFGWRVKAFLSEIKEEPSPLAKSDIFREIGTMNRIFDVLPKSPEALLTLRCMGNKMPYNDFIELPGMKNYHIRLSLLHTGVVDFGYEGEIKGDGDVPYVYLTERAAKILDNAYGKDMIEQFKQDKMFLHE